jgi:hypothetical protein
MLVYIRRKSWRTFTSYWIWFYTSFVLGEIGSYYQVWLVVVVVGLIVAFSVILAVREQADLL